MATTAIWNIKGWLGHALIYVENPDKTENPEFFQYRPQDGDSLQGLSDVLEYATQDKKVLDKWEVRHVQETLPP